MRRALRFALGSALVVTLTFGCAPRLMATGDPVYQPTLEPSSVAMSDGARLPLRVWPAEKPRAIIIGLHGMNDYSNAFEMPGVWFAAHGVTLYAYDQRGFGLAPGRGLWAGSDRMADDLKSVVNLVRARHPGLPVYLLGESMGGAVAMRAFALPEPPKVDGVILAAPAVWGWRSMNAFYETALWVSAHTVPSLTVTGQGLNIRPSDNIPMLRALGRDPLVIKETQIGTIYGLVNLMDDAAVSAGRIGVPVLLMYGAHDEIVPPIPVSRALRDMRAAGVDVKVACYPKGWHMLLRDLERETVWSDAAAWMAAPAMPLPSGADNLAPCEALASAAN
ncbi:MAG: lysophospholipase [Parvibaculum sp.]|uniref:alpha/beta hydrolase n=1 Tax=Parvibaculum sp. TaxID=2024848 RepID=UPI00283E1344|nr:alpha/beta hydrolase [Parvibaculum sp.]MDR3499561.1 lysophospholipase [Parvibaculum sp.]